ncbi:MAG: Fic family protein, partial [Candidatus Aminicenantes bacterium]
MRILFGFVYIHPFEDGNGRLHRFLMHHALARRGFSPPGLVFPVSATILERVDEYRNVLASYSSAILPLIKWEPTEDGNVCVLGETADLYRFFDATPHARFLYGCVDRTVEEVLPREVEYLRSHDRFLMGMAGIVEMPARKIELLLEFLRRNGGSLSN